MWTLLARVRVQAGTAQSAVHPSHLHSEVLLAASSGAEQKCPSLPARRMASPSASPATSSLKIERQLGGGSRGVAGGGGGREKVVVISHYCPALPVIRMKRI